MCLYVFFAGFPGAEAPQGSRHAAHQREAHALRTLRVHLPTAQLHELAHEEQTQHAETRHTRGQDHLCLTALTTRGQDHLRLTALITRGQDHLCLTALITRGQDHLCPNCSHTYV